MEVMRWTTPNTWIRIGVLCVAYLAIAALASLIARTWGTHESGMIVAFATLFAILPLITIGLAAWDGISEGFSWLWAIAPFVSFLPPMFLFFNEFALLFGVGYSMLGVGLNAITADVRKNSK